METAMNAKRLAVKTGRSSPDLQDPRADTGEPEVGGAYYVGKYIGGVSLWIFSPALEELKVDLSASTHDTKTLQGVPHRRGRPIPLKIWHRTMKESTATGEKTRANV